MLDSIPHSGGDYSVSKELAFEYFQNFEEYPRRYPKHCKWIEVIDRSENIVTTKEFWNIALDNDVDHVLITVRYELIPFTEIRYEIMSGYKTGIKNSMKFSDLESNPNKSVIEFALPILDITGHPYVSRSPVYRDLGMYLRMQDAICMENLQVFRFRVGQTCSKCKKGILGALPGELTGTGNHNLTSENFECDHCHEVFKNYLSVSSDTGGFV